MCDIDVNRQRHNGISYIAFTHIIYATGGYFLKQINTNGMNFLNYILSHHQILFSIHITCHIGCSAHQLKRWILFRQCETCKTSHTTKFKMNVFLLLFWFFSIISGYLVARHDCILCSIVLTGNVQFLNNIALSTSICMQLWSNILTKAYVHSCGYEQ